MTHVALCSISQHQDPIWGLNLPDSSDIEVQLKDSTHPEINAKVGLEMGITLRRLGYLDRSRAVLQESVETSPSLVDQGYARLELAHVQAALSGQVVTLGNPDLAQQYTEEAIASYTDIINLQSLPSSLRLLAKLSRLQFWIKQAHLFPAIAESYSTIPASWPELVREAEQLAPSRAAVFSQINLSQSLVCLNRPDVGLGLGCQQDNGAIAPKASGPETDAVPWQVIDHLAIQTLSIAPRLDLFRPEVSDQPLKILAGGVDIPQTIGNNRFPEIERLDEELSQIPANLTQRDPLVNEAFTKENIERLLQTGDFSAIHWKTHGVFSSNPAETYLVAYQDSIKANELGNLVQTVRRSQVAPLELMVLSACETAQGDSRAVLGLAGVAVQAGAKSTVSTLWRADDEANTRLMARFYNELSTGTTKAEALRQAQLSLINEVGYPAPYYWATYTLVGNWL